MCPHHEEEDEDRGRDGGGGRLIAANARGERDEVRGECPPADSTPVTRASCLAIMISARPTR
jgi:hypothetical protein